ncbi:hypothetical protein EV182_008391 [Spiromyces aspiralis]|uniref:Uncharacterized protein n=1 Tax=Spiromyces aspiralis TaxID=68401 RepID=A0ACC1HKM5_9FUNG|nr:hypothetical protein EV182_008391 [Spiromyces aspiralis]
MYPKVASTVLIIAAAVSALSASHFVAGRPLDNGAPGSPSSPALNGQASSPNVPSHAAGSAVPGIQGPSESVARFSPNGQQLQLGNDMLAPTGGPSAGGLPGSEGSQNNGDLANANSLWLQQQEEWQQQQQKWQLEQIQQQEKLQAGSGTEGHNANTAGRAVNVPNAGTTGPQGQNPASLSQPLIGQGNNNPIEGGGVPGVQ